MHNSVVHISALENDFDYFIRDDIEGFDSPNLTFVRFINDGDATISNIRGTLYDVNGGVLGSADTLLLDSLAARGATWLNRGAVSTS